MGSGQSPPSNCDGPCASRVFDRWLMIVDPLSESPLPAIFSLCVCSVLSLKASTMASLLPPGQGVQPSSVLVGLVCVLVLPALKPASRPYAILVLVAASSSTSSLPRTSPLSTAITLPVDAYLSTNTHRSQTSCHPSEFRW